MSEAIGAVPAVAIALASDRGHLRERNEDAVAGNAERCWILVADGMGGHRGGDVASAIVARELETRLDACLAQPADPDEVALALERALEESNRAVFDFASRDPKLLGMGSTAVLACLVAARLVVAHVGDSRAYLYRHGRLTQITRDHSLLQELIDGGMITAAEARFSPGRGVLTRSLGVDPAVDVEVGIFDAHAGDLLLLCSDGLTEMVPDAGIERVLATGGDDLTGLCRQLIDRANEAGGRDNVSVALMSVLVAAA